MTKQIHARIPDKLAADLDREAEERGIPRNQVIIERLSNEAKSVYHRSVIQFIEDIVKQVLDDRSKK